jgi:hypothetical protein
MKVIPAYPMKVIPAYPMKDSYNPMDNPVYSDRVHKIHQKEAAHWRKRL